MSFNIALSGIQAINEQLEAVSNNIANAGTYGFKSSRANFASVMAGDQMNGVEVASLTQNIAQNGGLVNTGRSMDAMIQGRGFFTSRDDQGVVQYTRVGIFSANKDGFLVDAAGRRVQGYGAALGGTAGVMGDIKIPTGQIPAVATTKIAYVGNLSSDWKVPTVTTFDHTNDKSYNLVKQSVVYDSLGTQHTMSQYFVKSATTNTVEVHYAFDGGAPLATPIKTLTFDSKGALAAGTNQTLTYNPGAGKDLVNLTIDYDGTSFVAGESTNTTNRSNGYASGSFVGVQLANDGSVIAKYSNEQQQIVGTLAIATFPDEGSLSQTSDTSWVANNSSGAPLYSAPGVGLAGGLSTGTLEGSNVDITSELVGLMTSQRNYQANSKVITAENQMMQALMQAL
ncbi:flagellar hook-basal body complex protein [Massilia sp. IC2-476]|uniref:flagellar hook-basal body complex protein n=1 Tax=Massilia sp. IC2-476 TaxID=2887199 RepID=UPI001D12DDE1|nr:flagellar hook-basal body complex protein [Massilia sp. IC2-476]MCC2971746.1 flagellar hook-basal body complex protein [Massilia sp. IC2-476]